MPNISDIIEEFLLENIEKNDYLDIARNELADFFSCSPSQINYVLSTRFTTDRGFLTHSQRGGGGYIRLTKVKMDKLDTINHLINNVIGQEITFIRAKNLLLNLVEEDFITSDNLKIIEYVISPKALSSPFKLENTTRANILKNLLINILSEVS